MPLIRAAAHKARDHEATFALTPAPVQRIDSTLIDNLDYLVMNEHEAAQIDQLAGAPIAEGFRDSHAS